MSQNMLPPKLYIFTCPFCTFSLDIYSYLMHSLISSFFVRRMIDAFQIICKCLFILLRHIFKCIADLMHDTPLIFCIRICRSYGLLNSGKSVRTQYQNILYTPVFYGFLSLLSDYLRILPAQTPDKNPISLETQGKIC